MDSLQRPPEPRPRRGLALAALALALALAPPAAAQDIVDVPRNWALTPSGLSVGDTFRLLGATPFGRNSWATDIADYNSFVRGTPGGYHAALQPHLSKFTALASTSATDARDNTATTYTADAKGVPIWWVNGDKVADDYQDFYDGSWDNKRGKGRTTVGLRYADNAWVWTGSDNDGTASSHPLGTSRPTLVRLQDSGTLNADRASRSIAYSLFALSPVFRVASTVEVSSVAISTAPPDRRFDFRDAIRVRIDFGEAMTVTGTPYLMLDIGGTARRADYVSGSGTRYLTFAYTVVRGETDSDGPALCFDTENAACGQIELNGGSIAAAADSATADLDLPDTGVLVPFPVDGRSRGKDVGISSDPRDRGAGYITGETIRVRVDFGEPMTVTGSPYLVLDVGGTARRAVYESGTGTHHLVFAYTVARGDADDNGVSLCANTALDAGCGSITLDGGSIVAQGDSAAIARDLPAFGNQFGHNVDAVAGTKRVSVSSTPLNSGAGYSAGETIRVRLDFGEAATVTGAPHVVLDIGGTARRAVYESGSGTRYLTFAYTVTRGETDDNGVSLCADTALDAGCGSITLDGGSILIQADSAVPALALPALRNQSRHKVDATAGAKRVSVSSTPLVRGAGYSAGETIRLRLDFVETVRATGAPYVVLDVGGNARRAVYASGTGSRRLDFAYTVVTADIDTDGVSLCANRALDPGCGRIRLAGGSILATGDSAVAPLDLPELGNQPGHKVDGMPGFVAPPMPDPDRIKIRVPSNWALLPDEVGSGEEFRLLFIPSTLTRANSTDIDDYNDHVIADAAAGHGAIRAFSGGFRVVASTETVDARDNAGLTGTGVPIYWLGGAKVADDYADLLDGSWDSERWTTEAGGSGVNTLVTVWSGSTDAGVASVGPLGGSPTAFNRFAVTMGRLNDRFGTPLIARTLDDSVVTLDRISTARLYGLSPVLRTAPVLVSLAFVSTPEDGGIYRAGERIVIASTFSEPVNVRGVPRLAFTLDGTAEAPGAGEREMRYVSGSGTARLRFEYVVQAGDFTGGGENPLAARAAAGESPIALDGGAIRAAADSRRPRSATAPATTPRRSPTSRSPPGRRTTTRRPGGSRSRARPRWASG